MNRGRLPEGVHPSFPYFLEASGECATLIRAFGWSTSPIGSPSDWPQPVQTLVQLMLAANQPMFIAWGGGRTLLYNDAYADVLADKHPGALGRDLLEVWAEIAADLQPIVAQAYAGKAVQMADIELHMERRGFSEETHFAFSYTPICLAEGEVIGLFCVCRETTGEVIAERELRASEVRFRAVQEISLDGFMVLESVRDSQGTLEDFGWSYVNEAAARIVGYPRDWFIGQRLLEVMPGNKADGLFDAYVAVVETGEPWTEEISYRHEGLDIFIRLTAARVGDGFAVSFTDLTERRQAEDALREAADRVRLALDAGAIIGTWNWDLPKNCFTADERFAASFGVDPEVCNRAVGIDEVVRSVHPDDKAGLMDAISEAIARGGAYAHQYRVRRRDGQYYWIEANGRVEFAEDGTPLRFPGVLLDIEQRRKMEAERDRALGLLRTFTEAVPGVVYAKDRDGRMLVANRGAAELIGMPLEAVIGKTDLEFLDDKEQAEIVMRNDRRIMDAGVPEQIEEEIRLPDGTPAVWLSTKSPLRGSDGEVIGLIGASVDITSRREAEDRERLLALEVDHRAKNMLAVVQSVVQLTRADDIEGFKTAVNGRIHSLARAHSLLAAARWEGVELSKLVSEEMAPFSRSDASRVMITGSRLRLRPAVSQALALVLHELATNAAKYGSLSREAGRVEISWDLSTSTGASQLRLEWLERGGPAVTAPTRNGFGSTVLRSTIERQLNGRLQLDWEAAGLRCTLIVPADQIAALGPEHLSDKETPEPVSQGLVLAGERTILVVEDEALIAMQIEDAILDMGWRILGPAATVATALALIARSKPDAAVLDINLNGERSDAIARDLADRGVPFAFCTGYANGRHVHDEFGARELLQKPFDIKSLQDALRRMAN